MRTTLLTSLTQAAALAAVAMLCSTSQTAHADAFTDTYLAAGVQTPDGITPNYETFTGLTYNGTSLVSNFNGSGITGTYTGALTILPADTFGGAGGTGQYISATEGSTYTLTLNSEVNYFGLWFSALDSGNTLSFYEGNTLVYSFTPATYSQLVGACPTASPTPNYCGNPNTGYTDNDAQQYAFLNFYDDTATFNTIVFTETAGSNGSFESDNQAVALLNPNSTSGTVIGATPEPSSIILLGSGLLGLAGTVRRRIVA